jgi:hypothetical protein
VRLLLDGDPTGLSSTYGQLAIAAGLAAAVVVALRAFWHNRRR